MAELLELLGDPQLGEETSEQVGRAHPLHVRMLDALPLRGGRTVADAARLAGVSVTTATGALAELEVLGEVEQRGTAAGGEPLWALRR